MDAINGVVKETPKKRRKPIMAKAKKTSTKVLKAIKIPAKASLIIKIKLPSVVLAKFQEGGASGVIATNRRGRVIKAPSRYNE
jgi:hypothetical protein